VFLYYIYINNNSIGITAFTVVRLPSTISEQLELEKPSFDAEVGTLIKEVSLKNSSILQRQGPFPHRFQRLHQSRPY
jgi:hypothetical protein